ncbi:hypothetical protein [Crossiella sp. CA198]|uniref:hypothetical protein n=1 Tax=Crossiella sp. CA198 TaxID=3455607 RepID=UPI003F8D4E30
MLQASTPAAAHTAVVAGDPCFDRMLRSLHLRDRYRAQLGVEPGQRLITITSTWSPRSLLGSWPSLFRETLAAVDAESTRVCAFLHPNIWHGHGPWQVHTWLADCIRAGLVLVPPAEGWQAALIAADLVLGDSGATSCYAAGAGVPVLLAVFPEADVVPGSAADLLGRTAPRLHRDTPLRPQLEQALRSAAPTAGAEVRAALTSCPGESADRLRTLFYRHLDLAEPARAAPVPVISLGAGLSPHRQLATADHIVCTLRDASATIARYPAEISGDAADHLDPACLVVHEDHAQQTLVAEASVVLVADLDGARERHRAATVLATADPGECRIRFRDSWEVRLRTEAPALAAAFVHTWLAARRDPAAMPSQVPITTGSRTVLLDSIVVSPLDGAASPALP